MLPKVSVHLASYQQRDLLVEALESALAQDYPNLEIVVGDDGSTDGTHEMLREYQARHPDKIRLVLSTENRGTTANWNQILPRCTGELVAWLDGDDVWLPGKISRQVAWFAEHPEAVLCYTNAEIFEHGTGRVQRLQHEPRRNPFREGGAEELMRSATFFVTSTVMVRRSAVPRAGCDVRLLFMSDWLFWVEVARNGRIGYVPEVLTRYRIHPNNITRRGDVMMRDQVQAIDIVRAQFPELAPHTRGVRAECLWYHGLRYLAQKDHEGARRLLRESFDEQFLTYNVKAAHRTAIYVLLKLGRLQDAVRLYEFTRRVGRGRG
jgi:glycosyltransferase involved in cell wall biosynthesis